MKASSERCDTSLLQTAEGCETAQKMGDGRHSQSSVIERLTMRVALSKARFEKLERTSDIRKSGTLISISNSSRAMRKCRRSVPTIDAGHADDVVLFTGFHEMKIAPQLSIRSYCWTVAHA